MLSIKGIRNNFFKIEPSLSLSAVAATSNRVFSSTATIDPRSVFEWIVSYHSIALSITRFITLFFLCVDVCIYLSIYHSIDLFYLSMCGCMYLSFYLSYNSIYRITLSIISLYHSIDLFFLSMCGCIYLSFYLPIHIYRSIYRYSYRKNTNALTGFENTLDEWTIRLYIPRIH
jgi:hypothetical protein